MVVKQKEKQIVVLSEVQWLLTSWHVSQGIIYSLLDQKKEAAEQFETYRALVPEEFPQRGFLNDVVLAAANNKCGEQFKKDFHKEFSYRKWRLHFYIWDLLQLYI